MRWNLLTAIPTAALVITLPAAAQLNDIATYWGEAYISALAQQDVLGGFPDGSFRPNETVTRAQFAAIATKAFGLNTNVPVARFSDPIPTWAAPAIGAAAAAGFVSGFPDGTFRPGETLTRVQAIAVLTRAAGIEPLTDTAEIDTVLSYFSDDAQIPNWARPIVAAATQAGLLVLYPNATVLNPGAGASRGEVAAFTYQAMSRVGRVPQISPPLGATVPGSLVIAENQPEIPVETLVSEPDLEVLAGAPEVQEILVRGNVDNLQAGETLRVVVRATPGVQAAFRIPGVTNEVPLTETREGQYEGSYTVRTQDRANGAPLLVILDNSVTSTTTEWGGRRLVMNLPVTTALSPPILILNPANATVVSSLRPEISARLDDLANVASLIVRVNGQDVTPSITRTAEGFTFTPDADLPVDQAIAVEVEVADAAGTVTREEWAFEVDPETVEPETSTPTEPELPDAIPEPEATAEPTPEATPEPEATAEPTPEATPEPEATVEPEPEVAPEPEVEPEAEEVPETEATAAPELEVEPDPDATPDPDASPEPSPSPQAE